MADLVARAELELAQDGADVRLDGAIGDPEPLGDALVGVAARQVVQDLALARRQRLQLVRLTGVLKACSTKAASRGLKHASPAATVSIALSSSAVSIVLVT